MDTELRADLHDVVVSWVESQCGGRRPVSDQVHPQELHRDEALWQPQSCRQEDADYLADVAADHVADERLHRGEQMETEEHGRIVGGTLEWGVGEAGG